MNDVHPAVKLFPGVDAASTRESMTIGLIGPDEFELGRNVIAGLEAYPSFLDWLDCREGRQIGLSLSGVEATLMRVRLAGLLAWCDLTGRSPSLQSLDAFASFIAPLQRLPSLAVAALVDARDFAARRGVLDGPRDYVAWSERRRRICQRGVAAGLHVVEQPVRLERFAEWRVCVGEAESEAALDNYAALLLEYLLACGEPWDGNCHVTV